MSVTRAGETVAPAATPRIGTPGPDDAGEILTVQRAAYVTEAQRYGTADIPPLRETLEELRADLRRADDVALLVRAAWLGTRLVGSVRGRVEGATMEVARFTVAPDVQGCGVGRSLLAALHAAAPVSVETFWLVTGGRSDDNQRFYRAAGYTCDGVAADDVGVELVRMRRSVRPVT